MIQILSLEFTIFLLILTTYGQDSIKILHIFNKYCVQCRSLRSLYTNKFFKCQIVCFFPSCFIFFCKRSISLLNFFSFQPGLISSIFIKICLAPGSVLIILTKFAMKFLMEFEVAPTKKGEHYQIGVQQLVRGLRFSVKLKGVQFSAGSYRNLMSSICIDSGSPKKNIKFSGPRPIYALSRSKLTFFSRLRTFISYKSGFSIINQTLHHQILYDVQ